MTEDQRAMATALLANAIRKEERLRALAADRVGERPLPVPASRGRADASGRYVQGMRDLIAVLFADGRTAADECYRAARALALGEEAAP
jgi:hypothetical protein